MIVALVGSHGTGKTTVFNRLRGQLAADTQFFSEQVRHQMPKFGYRNPDQFVAEHGIAAFELMNINAWSIIDPDANTSIRDSHIITERSAVDNYAYYLTLRSTPFDFQAETVLRNMARHYASLVDLFIYFPVGRIPLRADTMRRKDRAYQLEVDRNIRVTLDTFGVSGSKIHQLQAQSISDRTQEVIDVLQSGYVDDTPTAWELPAGLVLVGV